MDKIKLDIPKPEEESIKYNNKDILVKKYISFDEQITLSTNYCSIYFFPSADVTIKGLSDWNYFGAEYFLRMNILHTCTNIHVFNEDNSVVDGIDNIFYTNLWDQIVGKISNYNNFRFSLDRVVKDIEGQIAYKNSIGFGINDIIGKLSATIQQLSKIDLSPESLDKLKSTADSITKTIEDSPAGKLFQEAKKNG
jgi:hypothetical protein